MWSVNEHFWRTWLYLEMQEQLLKIVKQHACQMVLSTLAWNTCMSVGVEMSFQTEVDPRQMGMLAVVWLVAVMRMKFAVAPIDYLSIIMYLQVAHHLRPPH